MTTENNTTAEEYKPTGVGKIQEELMKVYKALNSKILRLENEVTALKQQLNAVTKQP